MITKNEIIASLKKINVPTNSVVIVHTSLKAIGEIEGGGQTLLDALIEHTTKDGGLLCIPTHTWGYIERKDKPTLDLVNPESNIGILPNLALKDKRGVRSMHPTHSLMVFGDKEKAEAFISGEEKVQTMTAPDGCYGKIYKMGGKVLLVGVGQNKNTFLHCVEEVLCVPNRNAKTTINTPIKLENGEIIDRWIYPMHAENNPDVSRFFPNYEPAFRKHNAIVDGSLGNAKVQLCDTKIMKYVMEMIFIKSNAQEFLYEHKPIPEEFY